MKLAMFEKNEIAELCKGVRCVDLGESFQTHIYLQNLASVQPRTSLVKLARSPRTDPPGGSERGSVPASHTWRFDVGLEIALMGEAFIASLVSRFRWPE